MRTFKKVPGKAFPGTFPGLDNDDGFVVGDGVLPEFAFMAELFLGATCHVEPFRPVDAL